ncbi:ABC transporter permease subunit [Mesorhizobium sp. M7A.F.Ca.US.006.01.1.1]|uniref:ABC transporter permease subunit n=1 Tax=Mesorhizobium sp. M7A.F.Ca.US.006.01.1.1 TaxID=2496707 RepID=UPI000FCA6A01|nr:ABC transporter permease subunit [Mesorhizobium sp. M7A.F.Ca.US.006.01.1.1]RUZ75211.1 ABC transporter permease subunit [Mesorhizobium sp. M7A.F.Ca.US.006.01.1.1]
MTFEWSAFFDSFPGLMQGARVTIMVALASLPIGLLAGAIVGVILTYAPRPLATIAQLYVGLIRGTPMIVQIMFIFFALPVLLGVRMDGTTAGILALVVNSSAYLAEIVRGGLLSVPIGLQEAGLAMGLPLRKVITHIVGPVAFRRMIPALGNQFIIGLKDTSLLIVIGVGELTRTGQEIMTDNYRAVEVWFAVAIIYLCIISFMAAMFKVLERRIRIA